METAARPRSLQGIVDGAAAPPASSLSRVLSSSSGTAALRGNSRKASVRQKASAIMRRTSASGAAGVSRA